MSLPLVAMAEPVLIAIFLIGSIVLLAGRDGCRTALRLAAIAVLAVTFLFLDLKAVLLTRAMSSLGGRSGHGRANRVVEARWASLTEWYVYDRTTDALQQRRVRAGGDPVLLLSWPIGAEPPLVTSHVHCRPCAIFYGFMSSRSRCSYRIQPAARTCSGRTSDSAGWRTAQRHNETGVRRHHDVRRRHADRLRLVVRRHVRRQRPRHQTAGAGGRLEPDTRAVTGSGRDTRNSTLANGVPSDIGRTSASRP